MLVRACRVCSSRHRSARLGPVTIRIGRWLWVGRQGWPFRQAEGVGGVGGDRVGVGWGVVEDGVDDGEVVQVEVFGEAAGLPGLLRRGHGPDQVGGLAEGVDPVFDEVVAVGPAVGDLVHDEVGQRIPPVESLGEGVRAAVGEQFRRVLPFAEGDRVGIGDTGVGQDPPCPDGGCPAGLVVVQEQQDPAVGERGDPVQGGQVPGGEGGAERCDGDQVRPRDVDGEGVHRSFDDHQVRTRPQQVDLLWGEPERQVGLPEHRGGGAVQVFRGAVVGVVGVFAADERDHRTVLRAGDGQHGPVVEEVDQPAPAGVPGQPGGQDLLVRVPGLTQVVD